MDFSTLFMVVAVIGVGYFLMVRPAQKRQAEQQQILSSLQPGTRVMLATGIFGTIQHLGERQAIIEIAPGVEMTVLKAAIARTVTAADDEFEYEDDNVAAADGATAADGTPVSDATESGVETGEFKAYPEHDKTN